MSLAVSAMLRRLERFLPPLGVLPSTVSLVSADEKSLGLGQYRGTDPARFAQPLKGLRVAATVRFVVWDDGLAPTVAEGALSNLTEALLAQKDELRDDGFVELGLRHVAMSEHVGTAGAWRQAAEFQVLYEFHYEAAEAGGLIARMPVAWREGFGAEVISGDVALWDASGAQRLVLTGRGFISAVDALFHLPGAPAAGSVRIVRTFIGATGAPSVSANLASFVDTVAGPAPQRHASVQFATLSSFADEFRATGAELELTDEGAGSLSYVPATLSFTRAIELHTKSDRLIVEFSGTTLEATQRLYLRGVRGTKHST